MRLTALETAITAVWQGRGGGTVRIKGIKGIKR
jgi:hypothetical protein